MSPLSPEELERYIRHSNRQARRVEAKLKAAYEECVLKEQRAEARAKALAKREENRIEAKARGISTALYARIRYYAEKKAAKELKSQESSHS